MRRSVSMHLAVLCAIGAACTGDADDDPGSSQPEAAQGGSAGSAGEDGASGASTAGSRGGAGATAEGDGGGEPAGDAGTTPDAGSQSPELVPLPDGSREAEGVVNLVHAGAAEELDAFLLSDDGPVHAVLRQDLVATVNLFLTHYEEVHDFLIVFTDHPVPGGNVGRFSSINNPAVPGGGNAIEIALAGYRSTGRLRAVIGVQWRELAGPPLAHEVMHLWAQHLDLGFGFGAGNPVSYGPHWGFSSVHGQLGGFDASTLRCETPAGGLPPSCTAGAGGRTRYVVASFFPNDNTHAPYAPLELYLMGVLPASEVPETFQLLDGAELIADSFDPDTQTVVVEADGLHQLAFADIVERHGEVELLPEDERHFTAAFAVISSEPAPDDVLSDVGEYAVAFGNRGTSPYIVGSFEELTGDRATLDTRLGPRRAVSSPAPEPRPFFECDLLLQDCPRPELACYGFTPNLCALSAGLLEGETCDSQFACAPGLDCFSGPSAPDVYACTPYCDPDDDSSSLACATLCPGMQQIFQDENGVTVGAICLN